MKLIPIARHDTDQFIRWDYTSKQYLAEENDPFVITNYLANGVDVNLLALSQSEEQIASGVLDSTDIIGDDVSISKILVKLSLSNGVDKFVEFDVSGSNAKFTSKPDGAYRMLYLSWNSKVETELGEDTVEIDVALTGHVNLELGEMVVYSSSSISNRDDVDFIELCGYMVNADRVNLNRLPE
jgi:hypothetical protein